MTKADIDALFAAADTDLMVLADVALVVRGLLPLLRPAAEAVVTASAASGLAADLDWAKAGIAVLRNVGPLIKGFKEIEANVRAVKV